MKGLSPLEHTSKLIKEASPLFSYVTGEDINKFQSNGKFMLKKLLGIENIESCSVDSNISIEYDAYAEDLKCREIRFSFESEVGVMVPCYLLVPKCRATPPLIIALHGHSTGVHTLIGRARFPIDTSAIADQECDFAEQAVSNGYAVLCLEHRGFGERGGTDCGTSCKELSFRTIMLGRTLIGERVWDAQMALDIVLKYFGKLIDANRIICLGYSGGGTIGINLSALDDRIGMAIIVSSISSIRASIGAMPHCPCNYIPYLAKYFDMGNICQLVAPRRLVVISGDNDPIFPISGAIECVSVARLAFDAFGAGDNIIHITGSGKHKFYPQEVWNILNKSI